MTSSLVDPKRISIINSQINIASCNLMEVRKIIEDYITLCKIDATARNGKPEKHHLVPSFILKNFEGSVDGYDERFKVIDYIIDSKGRIVIEILPGTSRSFSVRKNFYSIDELSERYEATRLYGSNDKYRMEKLLSIVEKNAAPLLKLRQNENNYRSSAYANPYLYPDNLIADHDKVISSSILDTTTGRRVALAVFFAMQYLRSSQMYENFRKNKIRIESEYLSGTRGKDFPEFIEETMLRVSLDFYTRSWRWVYSSFDNMMPSGTAILPLFSQPLPSILGRENSLMMPLGRNSTVYFLPLNSFPYHHDGVFRSKSLGVSIWSTSLLLKSFAFDKSVVSIKNQTKKVSIAMHPETNLAHVFRTGQEANPNLENKIAYMVESNVQGRKDVYFFGNIPRSTRKL